MAFSKELTAYQQKITSGWTKDDLSWIDQSCK